MSEPRESCEPEWAEAIDRVWLGRANGEEIRSLYAHLATCDRCRARYDRLAAADDASRKPESGLDPAARARVEAAILPQQKEPLGVPRWIGMLGFGAAAAAGILFFVVPVPDDAYHPRGVGSLPQLSLYCVSPIGPTREKPVIRGVVVLGASAPTLRCGVDDDLQIAYSRGSGGPLLMRVEAEKGDRKRPVAPIDETEGSVSLKSDVTNEPLPYSVRWTGADGRGTWRVRAHLKPENEPETVLEATLEIGDATK